MDVATQIIRKNIQQLVSGHLTRLDEGEGGWFGRGAKYVVDISSLSINVRIVIDFAEPADIDSVWKLSMGACRELIESSLSLPDAPCVVTFETKNGAVVDLDDTDEFQGSDAEPTIDKVQYVIDANNGFISDSLYYSLVQPDRIVSIPYPLLRWIPYVGLKVTTILVALWQIRYLQYNQGPDVPHDYVFSASHKNIMSWCGLSRPVVAKYLRSEEIEYFLDVFPRKSPSAPFKYRFKLPFVLTPGDAEILKKKLIDLGIQTHASKAMKRLLEQGKESSILPYPASVPPKDWRSISSSSLSVQAIINNCIQGPITKNYESLIDRVESLIVPMERFIPVPWYFIQHHFAKLPLRYAWLLILLRDRVYAKSNEYSNLVDLKLRNLDNFCQLLGVSNQRIFRQHLPFSNKLTGAAPADSAKHSSAHIHTVRELLSNYFCISNVERTNNRISSMSISLNANIPYSADHKSDVAVLNDFGKLFCGYPLAEREFIINVVEFTASVSDLRSVPHLENVLHFAHFLCEPYGNFTTENDEAYGNFISKSNKPYGIFTSKCDKVYGNFTTETDEPYGFFTKEFARLYGNFTSNYGEPYGVFTTNRMESLQLKNSTLKTINYKTFKDYIKQLHKQQMERETVVVALKIQEETKWEGYKFDIPESWKSSIILNQLGYREKRSKELIKQGLKINHLLAFILYTYSKAGNKLSIAFVKDKLRRADFEYHESEMKLLTFVKLVTPGMLGYIGFLHSQLSDDTASKYSWDIVGLRGMHEEYAGEVNPSDFGVSDDAQWEEVYALWDSIFGRMDKTDMQLLCNDLGLLKPVD